MKVPFIPMCGLVGKRCTHDATVLHV